jgi:hypothetical protein
MNMEHFWDDDDDDKAKLEVFGEESSPNVTLPTINPTYTVLVWNPCLRNVLPELSVAPYP